jgi:hypothetical protein
MHQFPPAPLETWYNGYRFRSRTEARWAVFFTTLGVPFSYEPEGYDLGNNWYLPDFFLPQPNLWLEIKGKPPTELEQKRAWLLAVHNTQCAAVFGGDVWHTTPGYFILPQDEFRVAHPCHWALCRTCGSLNLQLRTPMPNIYLDIGFCGCHKKAGMSCLGYSEEDEHTRRLRAAFVAARQARFERR